MNTKEPNKQPRPSYEDGTPRVPKVARMLEERGTTRDNFVALVKKAADTERSVASSHSQKTKDARAKA